MEKERRESVRIKKFLVALYSRDKKTWDMTHIRDISDKGMQITTAGALTSGEILTFLIKIPFKPFEWIEINGKTVESSELKTVFDKPVANTHITRIEFVDLREDHKKLICEYIEWFLSRKGG